MSESKTFRGTLIPIGGNENKGLNEDEGLDFIERGILSHVLKESRGEQSKVVVIPTASSIPETVGENYTSAFSKLGCNDVTVLNILKRSQSNSGDVLRHVRDAHCIMFSGGDQSRISKIIGDTALSRLLSERYERDDVVIAGTSAGAMAMSAEMVAGGSSTEAMLKGAVIMSKGLGLLPSLIIDTHFIQRGRFGRLAEAVAMFPDKVGIGLAEDTGLVIKNHNEFRVIGSGMVIVLDPGKLSHNNHDILEDKMPMSMSNLVTHILAYGDTFRISDRSVSVMEIAEWKGLQKK
jgi:cyanophycinase